jgi:ppGpp synthetase/RelA/SpoT-type nucleotidyltranferase
MHAFPLNTITMDLRQKVKRVRPGANVVQRLKRARSMLAKLQKKASMRLTQMQDIGGCRAVVTTIDEVYALREQYRKTSHCMFWSTKTTTSRTQSLPATGVCTWSIAFRAVGTPSTSS